MATLAVVLLAMLAAVAPSPLPEGPVQLEWEVVSRRPHDPGAYTQGLLLDGSGRLFESTGQWGESSVREVDPQSGEVLRLRAQPEHHFSEGLALVDGQLLQLTWQAGVARRFEADTFELVRRHRYEGEGWGLCYDGERLVMSDGSDRLTFRDPHTFAELGGVSVTRAGAPLFRLNELECVEGDVWANVYRSEVIVRIDPERGEVTGLLDLEGILEPDPSERDPGDVLNGIAWDPTVGTFLVTGKHWPELIEIRVHEPALASPEPASPEPA